MLKWLDPDNPGEPFPTPESALEEPNGLLAAGGCLSVERLVNAYACGIFPWFSHDEPILWWSPSPRWVLVPEAVKISRSLSKRLRRGDFDVTFDLAFDEVIGACAEPRSHDSGTWIVPEMLSSYLMLHRSGYAHSFECWNKGVLVGGLYGVAIGCCFFGESMFHRETDASKVAFVLACQKLQEWGYRLIDCQVHTAHLESLGAAPMTREHFLEAVARFGCIAPASGAWIQDR